MDRERSTDVDLEQLRMSDGKMILVFHRGEYGDVFVAHGVVGGAASSVYRMQASEVKELILWLESPSQKLVKNGDSIAKAENGQEGVSGDKHKCRRSESN